MAAMYNDELYEVLTARSGIARLQSFGVIFGYDKVVIYVEPTQISDGVSANTARTQLLVDGESLPWVDWATEFRGRMPEPIVRLMDRVAAGSTQNGNAQSIRDRLKQIQELFKFSRYRPNPDGRHRIDDQVPNTGGRSKTDGPDSGGAGGGSGGGGGGGRNSGRVGDIYSFFADTGTTAAEEVGGFVDPLVRWVSVKDQSRTSEFLEDRAAKYLPETNTIQANADFRVFRDMVDRWTRFYKQPSAEPVVEAVVLEWFQQQLVETVLGALALRRSGNWSEQEVSQLWSEDALTSAVLPRYHIDERIKRALGQKLGSLREKDGG